MRFQVFGRTINRMVAIALDRKKGRLAPVRLSISALRIAGKVGRWDPCSVSLRPTASLLIVGAVSNCRDCQPRPKPAPHSGASSVSMSLKTGQR